MDNLKTLQNHFLNYLLHQSADIESYVQSSGELDARARLGIYNNAYRARLWETIENDHPILGLYLGDELFARMADGYIDHFPSQHRSLRYFCESLPTYLQHDPFFSDYPLIADLARFERLLLQVFDAKDAEQTGFKQLQAVPEKQWPGLTFQFHPSLKIFTVTTSAVEWWQALKRQGETPPDTAHERYWLVWRGAELLTEFVSVPLWETTLLQALMRGETLAEACGGLQNFFSTDDIAGQVFSALTRWLDAGLISGFQVKKI